MQNQSLPAWQTTSQVWLRLSPKEAWAMPLQVHDHNAAAVYALLKLLQVQIHNALALHAWIVMMCENGTSCYAVLACSGLIGCQF